MYCTLQCYFSFDFSVLVKVFLFFNYPFELSCSYLFIFYHSYLFFSYSYSNFLQAVLRRHCLASNHYGHYLVRLVEGKHWHSLLY